MNREFNQIDWDEKLERDCRALVQLAIREDLDDRSDVTTRALVADDCQGRAVIVARQTGVICGIRAAAVVLDQMHCVLTLDPLVADGQHVTAGTAIASLAGPAAELLTAERLLLNLIGRLSGIATLARTYVQRIEGTGAGIYDTRKTTPGWRRLEKYAVRCAGARNHRTGLFDAVLIKDNHLAHVAGHAAQSISPGQAVDLARERLKQIDPDHAASMIVEVEVDSLEQLDEVLPKRPDIVLLDNMPPSMLREAVARRDALHLPTQLEASGGVTLDSIRAIAESGVDRISVGALTHSATSLDVALDWQP